MWKFKMQNSLQEAYSVSNQALINVECVFAFIYEISWVNKSKMYYNHGRII